MSSGRSLATALGRTLLIGATVTVGLVSLLVAVQHKLIYMPRKYTAPASHWKYYEPRMDLFKKLTYQFGEFSQTCYLLEDNDTRKKGKPHRVWLMFGGNAALALDWTDIILRYKDYRDRQNVELDHRESFLLVDYPGYGANQGDPSPESVLASTQIAVSRALEHVGQDGKPVTFSVLGHSLGGAAALQWVSSVIRGTSGPAARGHVDRLIVLSTFTTMADIAKHVLALPVPPHLINLVLKHRWDNTQTITSILDAYREAKSQADLRPLTISLIHGIRDEIVPVTMGKQLAQLFTSLPARVVFDYREVNCQHNDILDNASGLIFQAMLNQQWKTSRAAI